MKLAWLIKNEFLLNYKEVTNLNVGIYNPKFLIRFHNTDFDNIKKLPIHFKNFCNISSENVSGYKYDLSLNANKVLKFLNPNLSFPIIHSLKKPTNKIDCIYTHGIPQRHEDFFSLFKGKYPVAITTAILPNELNPTPYKKQAEFIATILEKCDMLNLGYSRKLFLDFYPELEHKTTSFIHFFFDFLFSEKKNPKNKNSEKIKIVFVGVEGNRKGLPYLISALDDISSLLIAKNVHIDIVSATRPEPKKNYPLKWHFRLPHHRVLELIYDADIYAMVPLRESFGMVFVEAMAAGCAIIADDHFVRKEILGNKAIFVPPRNQTQLKEALEKLIIDEKFRLELQESGPSRARNLFSPNVIGQEYLKMFYKTIENFQKNK